jgi:acetolactate synthase-1/2/3 large subunit
VQIPVDVLQRSTPPLRRVAAPPPARPGPAAAAIRAAAELLHRAQRPAIVLGGGAVDAGAEALALAELLDAPVGLTINARGTVAHSHPLCLGSALSFPPVAGMLLGSDGLLAVGTELSELDWWGLERPLEPPQELVRVDLDEHQLDGSPGVGLHGDATSTLRTLTEAVRALGPRPASDTAGKVARARAAIEWPASVSAHLELVQALDRVLPADRIVAADSTQPAYAANHAMPIERPRSWLMPIGYGTLGCALPMAIGAALAAPERPVLALAGDGGVLFTLQELATARDLGGPLPLVVWNNSGYGEIRDSMHDAGITPIGTDASAADFPAIARGFGCRGVRAQTPAELESAVGDALAAEVPTLIDAHWPTGAPA